jgi:hypothetical protein
MLTQELIPDLSTSWWVLVLAGQEVGNLGVAKLQALGREGRKPKNRPPASNRKAGRNQRGAPWTRCSFSAGKLRNGRLPGLVGFLKVEVALLAA